MVSIVGCPAKRKSANDQTGFNGGGQMVNDAARGWLQRQYPGNTYLTDDRRWTTISSQLDGCKRVFDGSASVKLDLWGEVIIINA